MRSFLLILLAACSDPAIVPDAAQDAATQDAAKDAAVEDATPDAGEADTGEADASEPLDPVFIDLDAPPPATLSSFNFFRWRDGEIEYNDGVFPYDLNTPLFSDFSEKRRAIYVPPGQRIQYREDEAFEFPVGSAIIKTFLFDRIIETRLLIRHADGWRPYPYLWREDRSDAD